MYYKQLYTLCIYSNTCVCVSVCLWESVCGVCMTCLWAQGNMRATNVLTISSSPHVQSLKASIKHYAIKFH